PRPYPAPVEVPGRVDDGATVAFRGTRYSVPPGLAGAQLVLCHRLGPPTLGGGSGGGGLVGAPRRGPRQRTGRGLRVWSSVPSRPPGRANARATIRPARRRSPPRLGCWGPRGVRVTSPSAATPAPHAGMG